MWPKELVAWGRCEKDTLKLKFNDISQLAREVKGEYFGYQHINSCKKILSIEIATTKED